METEQTQEKKQRNFFATSLKEPIAEKVRQYAKDKNINICKAVRNLIVSGLKYENVPI